MTLIVGVVKLWLPKLTVQFHGGVGEVGPQRRCPASAESQLVIRVCEASSTIQAQPLVVVVTGVRPGGNAIAPLGGLPVKPGLPGKPGPKPTPKPP